MISGAQYVDKDVLKEKSVCVGELRDARETEVGTLSSLIKLSYHIILFNANTFLIIFTHLTNVCIKCLHTNDSILENKETGV